MIEIDFIPQWYRISRNRRLWYQRQFLILGGIAILVALWCFIAGRSLSQARADLRVAHSEFESEIGKIQRYERLQIQYSALQMKAKALDSIVPRTSYASVLAELSHCVGPSVVMKKLSICSEPVDAGQQGDSVSVVGRTTKQNSAAGADKTTDQLPATQTRIVLVGYAADAQQVAVLISAMEQSNYFFRVVPVYSKNEIVGRRNITEFEIQCVLADFKLLSEKE
jgi:Tfp pilus assembly protein PilN